MAQHKAFGKKHMSARYLSLLLISLFWIPASAHESTPIDITGKWHRIVPGCSLFLDFSADGQCTIQRAWYDGREEHSLKCTARWKFDGWCIVLTPNSKDEHKDVIDFPIRLSLVELQSGERVLGLSLKWGTQRETIVPDVFYRGEFKWADHTSPDVQH